MELQSFINKMKDYKMGTYHNIKFVSKNGDYEKITSLVVRFIKYKPKNQNNKKVNRKKNTIVILKNILVYNENTNNYLVTLHTTKHHVPHVTYRYRGYTISKEEYYKNNTGGSNIEGYFTKKLQDVVEV